MAKTIEELRKIINEQEAALLIKEQQRLFLNAIEREALLSHWHAGDLPSMALIEQFNFLV